MVLRGRLSVLRPKSPVAKLTDMAVEGVVRSARLEKCQIFSSCCSFLN